MSQNTTEKFEEVLRELSESEQLDLIAFVAAKLKKAHRKSQPTDLTGYLVDKVEPDFDIEAALREAREEWLKEWDDNGIG